MARRRGRKPENKGNRKSDNQIRKQGFGSDLKPTRCSACRFNRKDEPCYKKRKLLSDQEYVDCVPAMIHYQEKQLVASGLISR